MKSTYTAEYQALISKLAKARKVAGITQAQLAAKLGKPQSYISKIENGERRLDVVEFLEIAKLIGIEATEFLG